VQRSLAEVICRAAGGLALARVVGKMRAREQSGIDTHRGAARALRAAASHFNAELVANPKHGHCGFAVCERDKHSIGINLDLLDGLAFKLGNSCGDHDVGAPSDSREIVAALTL
jgi:hypothetical protein